MTKTYATLQDFEAWELEAYADGVEMPHVAAFFNQHPETRNVWEKEQRQIARVQAALYRFDCPSPLTLQDYYWKTLAQTELQQFEAHLQICPHCTAELAELQNFLAVDTATATPQTPRFLQNLHEQAQTLLDQVQIVVATLVTPLTPQLAGVALRSDQPRPMPNAEQQTTLLFTAGETDISLLVQKDLQGTRRLAGQIFASQPAMTGVCKLIAANPNLDPIEASVDDTGSFIMQQLPPGNYQLVAALPEQQIVIPNLVI